MSILALGAVLGVVALGRPDSPEVNVAITEGVSSETRGAAGTTTTVSPATTTTAPKSVEGVGTADACAVRVSDSALPDPRLGPALASTDTGFLIFGGQGADYLSRGDLWTINCGGRWVSRSVEVAPAAEDVHSIPPVAAYDIARGETVVVSKGETLIWDGSTWTSRGTAPSLASPAAVYHDASEQVVLVGGGEATETWAWDGSTWMLRSSDGPPFRSGFGLVYDASAAATYLFGGAHAGSPDGFDDTWRWDGRTWTELSPAQRFPGGPMIGAYDPERDRTIALAFNGPNDVAETWAWDGSNWSPLSTERVPTRRLFAAMAYLPRVGGIVLFGGKTNTVSRSDNGTPSVVEEIVNDLWLFDGSEWHRLA